MTMRVDKMTRCSENFLLAALPPRARDSLLSKLELVHLHHDEVIHESSQPLAYALFPTTAIVSVSYVLANGQSSEIGIVGNDGIVGIALFMAAIRCRIGRLSEALGQHSVSMLAF